MLREQTICTLIGSSRAVRGWEARGGRPEVQDLEWEGQGVNLEEGWAAMVGAEIRRETGHQGKLDAAQQTKQRWGWVCREDPSSWKQE